MLVHVVPMRQDVVIWFDTPNKQVQRSIATGLELSGLGSVDAGPRVRYRVSWVRIWRWIVGVWFVGNPIPRSSFSRLTRGRSDEVPYKSEFIARMDF